MRIARAHSPLGRPDVVHEVDPLPGDGVGDDGPLPLAAGRQGGVGYEADGRGGQGGGGRGGGARDEKQLWLSGIPKVV